MKTKLLFQWLMILMFSAGALGAWAQSDPSPTQTVCIGNSIYRVDLTSGSTYNWVISPGAAGVDWAITGNGSANISVNWITPNLTTGYTLKVTETTTALCVGAEKAATVYVNPVPVLTDPGASAICSGSPTNIPLATTTTGATVLYKWAASGSSANVSGYSAQTTAIAGPIAQTLVNNGVAVETVTYIVTPVIGACTGTPVTIDVTVNPVPVLINPGTATICNGSKTNIPLLTTNTGATVQYTWAASGSSGNVTGFASQAVATTGPIAQTLVNSGVAVETVTYVVTPMIGTCAGTPVSIVITVNPTPVLADPGTSAICSGTPTNIPLATTNTGATVLYTWTVNGSSLNVSGYGAQGVAAAGPIAQTLTNSGVAVEVVTYIVTPVIGTCTGTPVTISVTVNPIPVLTDPGVSTICSAATTDIPLASLNTGATVLYTWTASGSSVDVTGFGAQGTAIAGPIAQALTNNGVAVETVTYIVTPAIGTCQGAPVTIAVTVNPDPVLTDPGPAKLCNGATTNIPLTTTNTGATVSYSWTVAGSSANVIGFSAQATATAGPIAQTLTNNGSAVETVTYIVTPVIGSCTGTPVTIVVTVNPTPVLTDPGASAICSGSPTNIPLATTNTGAAVLYSWTVTGTSSNVSGFSAQVSGTAGPIAQTLTNSGVAVETVSYVVTPLIGTCTGTPVNIIITVNPVPVLTDPGPAKICNGQTTNIPLATPNTGATVLYTWTSVGSSVHVAGFIDQPAAISGPIAQTLTNSGVAVETVTYVVTPLIGTCAGTPVTIVVTVNPSPVLTDPGPSTICNGSLTNIPLASINTGATVLYTWTVTGSSSNVSGFNAQAAATAGPIAQNLINSGVAVETVTYVVTPVIGSCTGTPVTIVVTVNPSPVVTDPSDETICYSGDTDIALISINTGAPVLYTWSATGSSVNVTGFGSQAIPSAGPVIQTLTNNGSAFETVTYIITPVMGSCTGTPITVIINVNPQPTPLIIFHN